MSDSFRVGVTRDFLNPDGTLGFGDIGLSVLDEDPSIDWEFLAENVDTLRSEQVADYDALLVLKPRVAEETVVGAPRLKVVARFGVGYDSVDVAACTKNGVLLTITPDGVRRPVAVSAITLLLALSHKLLIKDQMTREGRWDEKLIHMGQGLTGRTIGLIGLGNIGQEILRLARPFEMRAIGYDPYADAAKLADLGVELVDLDDLLKTADYIVICCALVPETHHLIDASKIELMKSGAYLINVARGPIVDQTALTTALQEKQIAGAALDVFEQEPVDPNDPVLKLDNVIVTPHGICWTDELFLGNGQAACRSIVDVAQGRVPQFVVNRDALDQPQLRAELKD